ncbi:MAG: von Willebrand factor type A domain-containing protein [Tannerella sp.]|jgi:Ca-activated chloride channel family protein|nr:von Willebrand factor type A domain-containing protein [Tannerella sp.]
MKRSKLFLVCGLINLISFSVFAQKITVSGIITDAWDGTAIAGVNILVKGTTTGTVSNVHGQYSISTEIGNTIVFSYIGYETIEMKVQNSIHDIQMKEDCKSLEEIIVVGYGIQRKSDITGSISVVSNEEKKSRKPKKQAQSSYNATAYVQSTPTTSVYDYSDAEEYTGFTENRFYTSKEQPLSTFSLDVDAASYSNIRRIINQGQIPSKDAVRIEELINYFNYEYEQPKGKHPVNIITEATICPWNEKHQMVRIGVKAKDIPQEELPPANLVFLIDVSGSMQGTTRLDLVKSSMKLLVNNLRNNDRVAIVTYSNSVQEVLSSTSGNNKDKIMAVIDHLYASGGTAGGAGIQLAYQIAEQNFIKKGNNRIILCSDGDFNIGISSPAELEKYIETKRQTGIFLTILGYGMGNYKDNRLQVLSEKGNGNHAYIDNIQEANKVLVNEFGGTMYTVAKDVKIQVEFNPEHVNAYRLIGYESRILNKEDFNDDTKDAGDLGAGHTVTALYEIIPVGVQMSKSVDDLKYQKTKKKEPAKAPDDFSNELLTVKLRYKEPASETSKRMVIPVLVSSINKQPSADFKFAMSVAMFGQILRESKFKGNATYQKAILLANEGTGKDRHGYRKEFIRLAESIEQLTK